MPRAAAFVDEIASELATWPGVRIERRPGSAAVAYYEQVELGVLDAERGVVELPFAPGERDELVERGDAEPAEPLRAGENVSHPVHGPSDITTALELFERRYRDLRGEDDPYVSEDAV